MASRISTFLLVVILLALGLTVVLAEQPQKEHASPHEAHEMVTVVPDKLQWQPGPASLPPGCESAVLEGDPTKPGMFTLRAKLPANYRIPPHTHPRVERVTVLSGALRLGMGRSFDQSKLQDLPSGSFFTMPPGMEHFAATGEQETVIQLTGLGPWEINYFNPDDDPRKRQGQRQGQ